MRGGPDSGDASPPRPCCTPPARRSRLTLKVTIGWTRSPLPRRSQPLSATPIVAVAEMSPADVVAAAQERGRARDLWATVEELLAELGE